MNKSAHSLERDRLKNNLIDRVEALERRVERQDALYQALVREYAERIRHLEEPGALAYTVPEPATGGRWALEVVDEGGDVGPVLVMVEL